MFQLTSGLGSVRLLWRWTNRMTANLEMSERARLYSSSEIQEGYPNGKEAVLKTAGPKALAGSNPVPSATYCRPNNFFNLTTFFFRRPGRLLYSLAVGVEDLNRSYSSKIFGKLRSITDHDYHGPVAYQILPRHLLNLRSGHSFNAPTISFKVVLS